MCVGTFGTVGYMYGVYVGCLHLCATHSSVCLYVYVCYVFVHAVAAHAAHSMHAAMLYLDTAFTVKIFVNYIRTGCYHTRKINFSATNIYAMIIETM